MKIQINAGGEARDCKFDLHFEGRDNSGIRKAIRGAADGVMPACGPVVERAVLSLAGTVAFTTGGRARLSLAASDYRAAWGEYDKRCDCAPCVAGSLQFLGALG